jgi:hypothetical protein
MEPMLLSKMADFEVLIRYQECVADLTILAASNKDGVEGLRKDEAYSKLAARMDRLALEILARMRNGDANWQPKVKLS